MRRRILGELVEPASPAEVARRVGVAAQLANYHVRALEEAGLAERVDTRQRRNLLEHRFRAVARSFALSSALPLSDEQRVLLQQDVALQHLVQTGDTIRNDALMLLAQSDAERHLATISLDVQLATEAERAAFVRAVVEAVRAAAAPYRARSDAADSTGYRIQLAVYPVAPHAE